LQVSRNDFWLCVVRFVADEIFGSESSWRDNDCLEQSSLQPQATTDNGQLELTNAERGTEALEIESDVGEDMDAGYLEVGFKL